MGERDVAPIMDDHRANIIIGQSVAGSASDMCRFEDDGTVYIRRDGVISAMRNAASYVAEQIAGFCGVVPARALLRSLDHGEATAPEQLEAAIRLRVLSPPEPGFSGLRITIDVPVAGGNTGLHTQGFNVLGTETQRLLDEAVKALAAEVDEFRRCPFHSRGAALSPTPQQSEGK